MNPQEIQGWFNWQALYDRMAEQIPDAGTIVELGVWKGASLAYLAKQIARLHKWVRIVGVDRFDLSGWDHYAQYLDPMKGTLLEQCRRNLDDCGCPEVELVQSDAVEAAELFRPFSVDFIFIDDLHDPDHVRREIEAWFPKMRLLTWIAGHDFSQVKRGVLEVFRDVEVEGDCWIAHLK